MTQKRTKTAKAAGGLVGGRKRVLVVLFVPSVERDGATSVDQDRWVNAALEMFGGVFGGATAYPKAKGIRRMGRETNQGEVGLVVGDEYSAITDFEKE